MRFFRANLALLLTAALAVAPAFATTTAKSTKAKSSVTKTTAKKTVSRTSAAKATTAKSSSANSATAKTSKKKTTAVRGSRGQQAIESSRVIEIQQALIRTRYLSGEPNGQWDSTTISAMQKLQANQGWQTRIMPDSRALKLLGLGPDYSKAINAAGASFSDPPPVSSIPTDQAEGFTLASGVKN